MKIRGSDLRKNEPFVKKFRMNKGYYIYDVNSNEIFKVDEIIFDIVDKIYKMDLESIVNKFKNKYEISDIKKATK
ncbi:MAG: hypothetical protein AB1410_10430 [Acidobacteriota bacterium]